MDETKMLHRLRRGDPDALETLMDRYLPYVSTVVWNILRGVLPPEDAEEVVSDVFLAAWEHAAALRPGHLRGWLGTVARNRAKNRLRGAGRERRLEGEGTELPAAEDPTEALLRQERRDLVRRALERFPEAERALLLRYYFHAQSVEEIAQTLSLKPATVKTRLRRGRAKLKDYLLKEGYDETSFL